MSDTLQTLYNLRGKYIKQILNRLERQGELTPLTRKIILDELNDLMREVMRELGYHVED